LKILIHEEYKEFLGEIELGTSGLKLIA